MALVNLVLLFLFGLVATTNADTIFDNLSGGVRLIGNAATHGLQIQMYAPCANGETIYHRDRDIAWKFTTANNNDFVLQTIELAVALGTYESNIDWENYFEVSIVADNGGLPGNTVIETWSFTGEAIDSLQVVDENPKDGIVDNPATVVVGASSQSEPTLLGKQEYWLVMSAGSGEQDSWVRWMHGYDPYIFAPRAICMEIAVGPPSCEGWQYIEDSPMGAVRLSGLPVGAPDDDGDGVSNNEDLCPASDLSPTVVILGCDTGVDNVVSSYGCTISELIADCLPIGQNSSIGENSTIGENSSIGDNTQIGSDTEIGDDVNIGDRALIGSGATVGEDADIGEGASVGGTLGEGAIIGFQTTVGANPQIGEKTIIGSSSTIGDNFIIAEDGSIGSDVTIGDDVAIGQKVTIGKGVTIGNDVQIGAEVTIGYDVTIGDGVVISNGETITQDVP